MGGVIQGHMLPTDVGLTCTELTLMPLPELSRAHLDSVGVITNPTNYLSGRKSGLGAVSAHWSGSQ